MCEALEYNIFVKTNMIYQARWDTVKKTDRVSTTLPTHTCAACDDEGGIDDKGCLEVLQTVWDAEVSVYVFVTIIPRSAHPLDILLVCHFESLYIVKWKCAPTERAASCTERRYCWQCGSKFQQHWRSAKALECITRIYCKYSLECARLYVWSARI